MPAHGLHRVDPRRRISTDLFAALASIALFVMVGLILMALRLVALQTEISSLRDRSLPRLVKLSQLSQESSASISIAPALSTNPSRYEFETLLSRIKDKEGSQATLIKELGDLISDETAADNLRKNSKLLVDNQQSLTNIVRIQIGTRKRLEKHIEFLGKTDRSIARDRSDQGLSDPAQGETIAMAHTTILRILTALLDPNQARFSRNRREILAGVAALDELAAGGRETTANDTTKAIVSVTKFREYWNLQRDRIFKDKKSQLTNEFKIKALVEENSLIANRLLSSANNEFSRTSEELTLQMQQISATTRFTLIAMVVVVIGFLAGSLFLWLTLKRRVFHRLDRLRSALQAFAENRERPVVDAKPDEIGEISAALIHYMEVIDQREGDLAEKTTTLERLSSQLAKYLSPQVYASIFSGKQEVKLASNRKKLTVFFSDIVGFTETADRLESEELTQLLNHYLTDMSRIALKHGATIDKYVGDAILIFFGDPETRGVKQDALACANMAIEMRDRLRELADIWRQSGVETPLVCRMGVHTGYCTVGNFGSEDRLDYTIIGGAVNTASRLETVAKPGDILISYETFAHIRDEIQCEEHGEVDVKGIAYPIATFRVVDRLDRLKQLRHRLHEEHTGLKIDLDTDTMTVAEQDQARIILRRALKKLDFNGQTTDRIEEDKKPTKR